jgi:hypothetical protein
MCGGVMLPQAITITVIVLAVDEVDVLYHEFLRITAPQSAAPQ